MNPAFLICGIEHSGTTLVSDLFRQVPGIDSGFEVGVLLAESPRAFRAKEPFVGNLVGGWGLAPADLDHLCNCDTYGEFYARLVERSGVVSAETARIFDKTPRYLQSLEAVIARMPVPTLVCHKDPRAIVASDYKRARKQDKSVRFATWYPEYLPRKKAYLQTLYANSERARRGEFANCLNVPLEALCLDTRRTLEVMFAFVGVEFSLRYLNLDNLRYAHTRAPFIASNIPFDYFRILQPGQMRRIERDLAELGNWFYR